MKWSLSGDRWSGEVGRGVWIFGSGTFGGDEDIGCGRRIVVRRGRAEMGFAAGSEQIANVLLVLARERSKRRDRDAPASSRENHFAVVNSGEFCGVLFSRDFVP